MASLYYLENFNNYYNRTMKLAGSRLISAFQDYILKADSEYNFNPNDHITTSVIVNYTYYDNGVEVTIDDDENIDYLLVSDDGINVKSKWFVIDRTRTLGGQWMLSLRRDLVADYIDEVKGSPAFVEKGWIRQVNNLLIFNKENMQLNRIKQKEVSLQDKTGTPWIVGYISNNYYDTSTIEKDTSLKKGFVKTITEQRNQAKYKASWIELSALNLKYVATGASINSQSVSYHCDLTKDGVQYIFSQGANYPEGRMDIANTSGNTNFFCSGTESTMKSFFDAFKKANPYFIGPRLLDDYMGDKRYIMDMTDLKLYNGQVIENSDYVEGMEEENGPQFFTLNLNKSGARGVTVKPPVNSPVYNEMVQYLYDIYSTVSSRFYFTNETSNVNTFWVSVDCELYQCVIKETLPYMDIRTDLYDIDENDNIVPKQNLFDAPYTMFATPYNDCIINVSDEYQINHIGIAAKSITSEISKILGGSANGSAIYDLQLLPYCPLPSIEENAAAGSIDMRGWEYSTKNISTIKYGPNFDNDAGLIFWIPTSSFNNIITLEEPINIPTDSLNVKIDSESVMCRLVSPNYSGAFEFTPVKNGGVSQFEVNCTYKPFQPYIHINPVFNVSFLYGGDFDDNRGLVCGGDFSLPQVSDAWINYQIQNRSFRESFNRQIENMEVNNAVQREKEIWGAVGGAFTGAAGGAMAGNFIGGGPAGMAAGAAVSGALSIAGGVRDVQLGDKLRAEAIDYTKDQFGYSLQNIQALPVTMSRTSSFDVDNKLFPFLEFYDCSSTEKEALKNKILYNGMTVMVVGNIGSFIGPAMYDNNGEKIGSYVKAKLIRFLGNAETHEVRELSQELDKGVFFE